MQVQRFTPKAFFRLFPVHWWASIGVSSFFLLAGSEWVQFFSIIINVSATVLLFKAATIIHESGHLLAARVAGGKPSRMVLGVGQETYRTEIAGIKIIFNSFLTGGYAIAFFNTKTHYRLRQFFYTVGGVLLNVLVAGLFLILFGFDLLYWGGKQGVDIASAVILTNGLAVINLLPFPVRAFGMPMHSDGLSIILLFIRPPETSTDEILGPYLETYEHFEMREYDKAYAITMELLAKHPDHVYLQSMLAALYMRKQKIAEAETILLSLVSRAEEADVKPHLSLVYNNLAWVYQHYQEQERAFDYAARALKLTPKSETVIATYGAALVQKGEYDSGILWLNKIIDTEVAGTTSLNAAMYLAVAFHEKASKGMAAGYRDFVDKNVEKLDADDRILWERNKIRLS